MNRCIDADKLIAEIKALKYRKGFLPFENTEITEAYMARGIQFACDDIVSLITSLQQEQPECPIDTSKTNVFPTHIDWDGSPINTKRIESGDIEYIRKDALLEWAKEKQRQMKVEAGTCHIISAAGKFLAYKEIIEKIESL